MNRPKRATSEPAEFNSVIAFEQPKVRRGRRRIVDPSALFHIWLLVMLQARARGYVRENGRVNAQAACNSLFSWSSRRIQPSKRRKSMRVPNAGSWLTIKDAKTLQNYFQHAERRRVDETNPNGAHWMAQLEACHALALRHGKSWHRVKASRKIRKQ